MERVEVKKQFVSCLKNERVIIRYVNNQRNGVTNPKHVLYGGMAETAVRTFVVPRLTSGRFVNVLTDDEKEFLENIMGLEENALSIYKREHNFWDDSNSDGIAKVILKKQDNYLDLSSPEDYIRYKILLANKDLVAPSLKDLEDHPKATYQYVCIAEGEEAKVAKSAMSVTMACYKEYGKVEDDRDTLVFLVETLSGRPVAGNSKIEFIQSKINELIQANPKMFLKAITDKMLGTKVLIKKSVAKGTLTKRGDYYYLKSDGKPLCEDGEEPTINIVAAYLNNPKHQTVKISLEAELKRE